jgi:hypothetical protein
MITIDRILQRPVRVIVEIRKKPVCPLQQSRAHGVRLVCLGSGVSNDPHEVVPVQVRQKSVVGLFRRHTSV